MPPKSAEEALKRLKDSGVLAALNTWYARNSFAHQMGMLNETDAALIVALDKLVAFDAADPTVVSVPETVDPHPF